MEMNLIRDLGKSIKNGSNEKPLDGIDLYVRSLAEDLRKLPERDYLMVKNEIQGIMFRYQMAQYDQGQGTSSGGLPTNSGPTTSNQPQPIGPYTRWLSKWLLRKCTRVLMCILFVKVYLFSIF